MKLKTKPKFKNFTAEYTEPHRGKRIPVKKTLCNSVTSVVYSSFCLIIMLSVSACNKDADKKAGAEAIIPVFAVNTILAAEGQIQDYITFSGDIIAGSTIDVYPEAAGKVTEIYVTVGRRVNRGDRIASIDPSRPGMTFRQNVATAPISGTVVMIPAQIGMTVAPQVPLVRIAGGGGMEIKLNVAERFISRMALNQPCEITLDAWPGEVFNGSVSEVSPTVDTASRTMEVRVNVRDSGSKLKAGMFEKCGSSQSGKIIL